MEPTQHTGDFSIRAQLQTDSSPAQLRAIAHQIYTTLQKAIDHNPSRAYAIKITANITVEPWEAEIGEYVHSDHFQPNLGTQDQILESPSLAVEKRVFQPMPQGYQRIE